MLFCHGRGVRIRSGRVGGVPTATVGSTLFRFRARSRSAATETRRRRPTAAAGLVSEIYGLRRGRSSPVVLRRNENAQVVPTTFAIISCASVLFFRFPTQTFDGFQIFFRLGRSPCDLPQTDHDFSYNSLLRCTFGAPV